MRLMRMRELLMILSRSLSLALAKLKESADAYSFR